MDMKKIKGQESGITLLALVITITILLILAGISLRVVTGEKGIIKNIELAEKAYRIARVEEEIKLIVAEVEIDKYGKGTLDDFVARLKQKYDDVEYIVNFDSWLGSLSGRGEIRDETVVMPEVMNQIDRAECVYVIKEDVEVRVDNK